MEIQLMKRLKSDIQVQLKSLTVNKFQSLITQRPTTKYLSASIRALEMLYSMQITTPYFYNKLQEFETLTFNFEFKRERILKAKQQLLGAIMRQDDKVQDPKSMILFISLVENLVAFAEIHYTSIKEFSRVMHQQLNQKPEINIQITKINEHLQTLNKLQLQNRQMLLKLPLENVKDQESEEEFITEEQSNNIEQNSNSGHEQIQLDNDQCNQQDLQQINILGNDEQDGQQGDDEQEQVNQELIILQDNQDNIQQDNQDNIQQQIQKQQDIKQISQQQQENNKIKQSISVIKVSEKLAKLQTLVYESLYGKLKEVESGGEKEQTILQRPIRNVRPATRTKNNDFI